VAAGSARVARWIETGVAGRALPGERTSGDREVVRAFGDGVLLAAVDGLGHGAEAAEAARRACAVLERHAGESVIALVQRCHADLVGTRGVALSLASVERLDKTLTWIGVGNVDGSLWQRDGAGRVIRSGLLTRGGVVGGQLPPLRAEVLSVGPGDVLIFATDGVGREYADQIPLAQQQPQELADRILSRHARTADDALVVAVRFLMEG
jgi:hypothetical protein